MARKSPRLTRPATSPGPCVWSWAPPTGPTNIVEENAPWTLRGPGQEQRLQDVCTIQLNLFRQLAIYLAPVLPRMAVETGKLLGDPIIGWEQSQRPLLGTPVAKFQHLMQRVDQKAVDAMIAASAEPESEPAAPPPPQDSDAPLLAEPLAAEVSFEEFVKVDLRVARVLAAEEVPGAKKLLKLTLGLGGQKHLNVFAGIKSAYRPEDLVGRLVICAANLAPRKMKFGMSEGMVVAAGGGENEIFLLSPDTGAKPGQRVH